MAWEWPTPRALEIFLQANLTHAAHFGLLLDKLTPEAYEGSRKSRWLAELVKLSLPGAKEAIQVNYRRWRAMVEAAGGRSFRMMTASPLIVGLGAAHVLETSITLDRNTGAPIIPGSALKGLARTVGLIAVAEKLPFAEQVEPINKLAVLEKWIVEHKTLDSPTALDALRDSVLENPSAPIYPAVIQLAGTFKAAFGTTDNSGGVIFVDGVYAGDNLPKYAIDIMNPHFPDYYTGSEPPSDDQDPVPVAFLTVGRGQAFEFALLLRMHKPTELLQPAEAWLRRGLIEFGVGAKTAQGYGLFSALRR